MTHGQETEGLIGSVADGVVEVRELVHQVVVREHHALGRTSCARSIDDGGTLHFIDSGLTGGQLLSMRMFLAELEQLVEIGIFLAVDHGIDQLDVGRIRQNVGHLVHHAKAVDDDHLGIAIVKDVTIVFLADGRIDRNRDGTHLADGHVEHVPFGTVGQNHRNLVAFLDA